MNSHDLLQMRLANQQLTATRFSNGRELVRWMGAVQAQDCTMARWALGVRLPGSTDRDIKELFSRGGVLRTHVMRPTWHFVAPEDIRWMIDLTGPRITLSLKSRRRELGLTEALFAQSGKIIKEVLSGDRHMTKEELVITYAGAGISTDTHQVYHLLLQAELDGLICSGIPRGTRQTFALLEERASGSEIPGREEALKELARRYFSSHGPATVQDFTWWSGLPVKDARLGLEMNEAVFTSAVIDSETYWFLPSSCVPGGGSDSASLLPAFDEFLISYKSRKAAITDEHHRKAISDNGVFRPLIVVNGQVAGIWSGTMKKDTIILTMHLFRPLQKRQKESVEKQASLYGRFLERKVEIVWQ